MANDEIVGHKTFSTGDPLHPFRHEPLTRAEADAIWKQCEEQREAREKAMPTAEAAVRTFCDAHHRLKELGWREFCYAPVGPELLLIEPGSSGIHRGRAEGEWPNLHFWIYEAGDVWPSHPVLFMLAPVDRNIQR